MTALGFAYFAFGLMVMLVATWLGLIQRVQVEQGKWLLRGLAAATAVLALVALFGSPGTLGGVLAGLALLVGGGFLFLGSLAGQSDQGPAFAVGDPLPEFEALDEHGEPFRSTSLRGRPVLIKFFRGHW